MSTATEPPAGSYGLLCARVYQLDKPVGTSFGDVEFYRSLLDGVRGEILEPAVGTGRILIPLAESFPRIRGFDTSAPMLEICRENLAARRLDVAVFQADLLDFRAPSTFEAVIVPTGSFALLIGRDRAAAALRNVRDSLVPGGRFIVDVEPPKPPSPPGTESHGRWRDGDALLTLTARAAPRRAADRWTSHNRYELWRDGRLEQTEDELFELQLYGLGEFTAMLRDAGFGRITAHANYQAGHPPTGDSDTVWTFEATAT
ncbi:class I SAM-dependent methyltransferase [Parafrankia sp. FMc6]|uniref:class I SAM-dependent methyltransferase n=1 Tax=Parafrankia soli TaxID=2599596 RepID=UPI0034D4B825